jgi:cellulose synthase/poly-beta-1,6-N-acetylglucosamine synthase-like glycosyltransferase
MPVTRHKLTVLAALHEDEPYIHARLRNLCEQTCRDFHVIFLNNLNKGNVGRLLRHLPFSCEEVHYREPKRLYDTWNDGLARTASDYVCNANADDHWHPEYLERAVAVLDRDPGISVVTSHYLITDAANQDWPHWTHIVGLIEPKYPGGTLGPCPVFRRSLIKQHGPFRADLSVAGDAEIWERWHRAGALSVHVLKDDLILYLTRHDSLERRRDPEGRLLADVDSVIVNSERGPPLPPPESVRQPVVTRVSRRPD